MSRGYIEELLKQISDGHFDNAVNYIQNSVWPDKSFKTEADNCFTQDILMIAEAAADAGCSEAMNQLGAMYAEGYVVEKNELKSFEWYKRAADLGHDLATSNLGFCYLYGKGTEKNFENAFYSFVKAAVFGIGDAIVRLGDMYLRGLYVQQDDIMAFKCYMKAYHMSVHSDHDLGLQQVCSDACLRLGDCFRNGYGTEQDENKAIYYYLKAYSCYRLRINAGDPYASSGYKKIQAILKPLFKDMNDSETKDEHILVTIGKSKLAETVALSGKTIFLENSEANALINNIQEYPHALVLACLMDRQIQYSRAWEIPFKIMKILGAFDIDTLSRVSQEEYKQIFEENNLHRLNSIMANVFYNAVRRIKHLYNGDVSSIWKNSPSSSRAVYDFMQFEGCGVKISTMIVNILIRNFGVKFADYYAVDVSPDVHVMRVMRRMGLIESEHPDDVIYKAKELYPYYPGIIDEACWDIGRKWCHASNPDCIDCPVKEHCKQVLGTWDMDDTDEVQEK